MKGEDLKKLLENNPYLLTVDIRYTIAYLLKKRLINPSVLIDEYANILNEETDKLTEDELKERLEYFKLMYGFNPERE